MIMLKTTPAFLFVAVLAALSPELAHAEARFTVKRGRCYSIPLNTNAFVAHVFAQPHGLSNYSCEDAIDNFDEYCSSLAKQLGYPNGRAYRDVRVTFKSASSSESMQMSLNDRSGHYLFGIAGITHSQGTSFNVSRSEATATQVEYVDLNAERDCRVNTQVPQESEPTLQSGRYQ